MPLTVAAPTVVPGLNWVCSSTSMSFSRSVFRSCVPLPRATNVGCHEPTDPLSIVSHTKLEDRHADLASALSVTMSVSCFGGLTRRLRPIGKTSPVRRLFSGRDSSGAPRRSSISSVLMLAKDQSCLMARISLGFWPSYIKSRSCATSSKSPTHAPTLLTYRAPGKEVRQCNLT